MVGPNCHPYIIRKWHWIKRKKNRTNKTKSSTNCSLGGWIFFFLVRWYSHRKAEMVISHFYYLNTYTIYLPVIHMQVTPILFISNFTKQTSGIIKASLYINPAMFVNNRDVLTPPLLLIWQIFNEKCIEQQLWISAHNFKQVDCDI